MKKFLGLSFIRFILTFAVFLLQFKHVLATAPSPEDFYDMEKLCIEELQSHLCYGESSIGAPEIAVIMGAIAFGIYLYSTVYKNKL